MTSFARSSAIRRTPNQWTGVISILPVAFQSSSTTVSRKAACVRRHKAFLRPPTLFLFQYRSCHQSRWTFDKVETRGCDRTVDWFSPTRGPSDRHFPTHRFQKNSISTLHLLPFREKPSVSYVRTLCILSCWDICYFSVRSFTKPVLSAASLLRSYFMHIFFILVMIE